MKDNKLKGKALDNYVKDLQVKTFMYGSSTTIKINSTMMQLLYQNKAPEKQIQVDFGEEKEPDYRIIVYTAYMIASLKKDFTGYDISPREFLEVKITDLNHTKEAFDKAEKQVKKELLKKKKKYKILTSIKVEIHIKLNEILYLENKKNHKKYCILIKDAVFFMVLQFPVLS